MYSYDPTEELNEAEHELWREDESKVSSQDSFPESNVDFDLSPEVFCGRVFTMACHIKTLMPCLLHTPRLNPDRLFNLYFK